MFKYIAKLVQSSPLVCGSSRDRKSQLLDGEVHLKEEIVFQTMHNINTIHLEYCAPD